MSKIKVIANKNKISEIIPINKWMFIKNSTNLCLTLDVKNAPSLSQQKCKNKINQFFIANNNYDGSISIFNINKKVWDVSKGSRLVLYRLSNFQKFYIIKSNNGSFMFVGKQTRVDARDDNLIGKSPIVSTCNPNKSIQFWTY